MFEVKVRMIEAFIVSIELVARISRDIMQTHLQPTISRLKLIFK